MTGLRLDGKVALVTGAARGQGRSHAVRLAEEGADVIGLDICHDLSELDYPLASTADLAATSDLVVQTGRRMITSVVDVRDLGALRHAVDDGVEQLGRLDVVVANAGVCAVRKWEEIDPELWDVIIGTNLTGVWNTCAAALPHLVAGGGGSLILVSSAAGLKGQPFFAPYAAAKHGLVGLMRSLANELATRGVRVNSVHPTGVDTPMLAGLSGIGARIAERPELGPLFRNALPLEVIDPVDVSHAVMYLASDDSRAVTGHTLAVDAGISAR
ncbi:MAG: mycofactocin-coupled SDR family oxidoreductase [Acidimicrobiales bacterium]